MTDQEFITAHTNEQLIQSYKNIVTDYWETHIHNYEDDKYEEAIILEAKRRELQLPQYTLSEDGCEIYWKE